MALLTRIPIKTLDATHIVIAQGIAAAVLVTSDRVMADAAGEAGFEVVRF